MPSKFASRVAPDNVFAGHQLVEQIINLIEQRAALTIRRRLMHPSKHSVLQNLTTPSKKCYSVIFSVDLVHAD